MGLSSDNTSRSQCLRAKEDRNHQVDIFHPLGSRNQAVQILPPHTLYFLIRAVQILPKVLPRSLNFLVRITNQQRLSQSTADPMALLLEVPKESITRISVPSRPIPLVSRTIPGSKISGRP